MLTTEQQRKRLATDSTTTTQPKRKKQLAMEFLSKPTELVGKDIIHRFINDKGEEELWAGKIIGYDPASKEHTLTYTGDTDKYMYNLTPDITNGDLWVLLYQLYHTIS